MREKDEQARCEVCGLVECRAEYLCEECGKKCSECAPSDYPEHWKAAHEREKARADAADRERKRSEAMRAMANGQMAAAESRAEAAEAAQAKLTEALRAARAEFRWERCGCCDRRFEEQDGVQEECAPLHHAMALVIAALTSVASAPTGEVR